MVTGAARGIGRATAELLVRRGYAVVLTDVDADAVARTAAAIGAVAGIPQDVRDEASHATVAAEALRHGPLTVWVNNAGVGDDGTLADLPSAAVDRLVDVNLKGVLWGMRAAMGAFGAQGGDIVNVASLSGLGPVPGLSTYAATKAAVVSLSTSVALEVPDRRPRPRALPDRRRRADGGRHGAWGSAAAGAGRWSDPDAGGGRYGRGRPDRQPSHGAQPARPAGGDDAGRWAAAVAVGGRLRARSVAGSAASGLTVVRATRGSNRCSFGA